MKEREITSAYLKGGKLFLRPGTNITFRCQHVLFPKMGLGRGACSACKHVIQGLLCSSQYGTERVEIVNQDKIPINF